MSIKAELLFYAVNRMKRCTGLAFLVYEAEARRLASDLIARSAA